MYTLSLPFITPLRAVPLSEYKFRYCVPPERGFSLVVSSFHGLIVAHRGRVCQALSLRPLGWPPVPPRWLYYTILRYSIQYIIVHKICTIVFSPPLYILHYKGGELSYSFSIESPPEWGSFVFFHKNIFLFCWFWWRSSPFLFWLFCTF